MTDKKKRRELADKLKVLTFRQREWLDYYLYDCPRFNATAAARKAGYGAPTIAGHNNLRNANICAILEIALVDSFGMPMAALKAKIVTEIGGIAFSRLEHYLDNSGKIDWRLFEKHPAAVKEYRVNAKGDATLKLQDKKWALDILAKMTGLHSDQLMIPGLLESLQSLANIQPPLANDDLEDPKGDES